MLGYCMGIMYGKNYDGTKRRKVLLVSGVIVTLFFIGLRLTNIYGDPSNWQVQKNGIYTVLSFLNLTKYPPSLLYLAMTLGPALIVLSFTENVGGKWSKIVSVYGRVPFFYFLVHFFLLHFICMIIFFINGHSLAQANTGLLHFRPDDFGYSLGIVYLIWIAVVVSLYPICKRYDRLKSSHKYWWLSYL